MSCSARTLCCPKCVNFSKSPADSVYHIVNKVAKAIFTAVHKSEACDSFYSFYSLPEHKRTEHGAELCWETLNVDVEHFVGEVAIVSLNEDLETCEHFSRDSEMENRSQSH